MARLIKHERSEPYEFSKGSELPIYICACGLSKSKPYCDGSHKSTNHENDSDLYVYDDNNQPTVVATRERVETIKKAKRKRK